MILSKEEFVDVINRINNLHELKDRINKEFDTYIDNTENDFCNAGSICISLETPLVKTLETMFNDGDTISWWIYELDCGKKYKKGCITEQDGTPIDVSTPEKLYDYLIENYKEG